MASLEEQPLVNSFNKVFLGAAGGEDLPSDDQFNRVSFLSHFEGANNGVNNAFDDGSTNNYTVTAAGNVTQGSFGPFARPDGEWGVRFPENHPHYFDIASSSDFAIGANADYTFELFVFYNSKDSNQIFMDYRTAGSNGTFPIFSIQGDETYNFQDNTSNTGKIAYSFDQGVASLKSATKLTLNTWNHVAIVRNSGTINIYINGTRDNTSSTSNTTVATQAAIRFGDLALNSVGTADSATEGTTEDGTRSHYPDLQFSGVLSNFRFVNGTAVYSGSSITVPTSKLTAITNTKLLLFQSNRFVDNSASGHTVPASEGSPAVTSFGPFLSSAVYDPAVNGASAANFSSSSDYITVADSSDFTLGNTFTLEAWIYPTASNGYNSVQNQDGSSGYYWAHVSGEKMQFYKGVGSAINHDSAASSMVNQWTHVAYVCAGGTAYHYINGVRSGSSVSMSVADISAVITIGAQGGSYLFPGFISDYRMVVGTAVYSGTTYTVPTAPLTAITNTKLLLNMANGQAIDSAAQNNLTLVNDAKISTTRAKFGATSLYLDGSDYAIIDNSQSRAFGTGDFTVELFIWLNGGPDPYDYIFDMRNSSATTYTWALSFNYLANTSDKLMWCSNNTSPNAILSADYPSLNQWVHIAVCRSGTTSRMFYDGTQVAINTSDSADYRDIGYPGYIGCRHSIGNYINAYMDEIRFSKMARYTSNFTAPSAPFADKGQ